MVHTHSLILKFAHLIDFVPTDILLTPLKTTDKFISDNCGDKRICEKLKKLLTNGEEIEVKSFIPKHILKIYFLRMRHFMCDDKGSIGSILLNESTTSLTAHRVHSCES